MTLSSSRGSVQPYYEEGGITIYLGDCREILPTLEPVDLVVTSPSRSSTTSTFHGPFHGGPHSA